MRPHPPPKFFSTMALAITLAMKNPRNDAVLLTLGFDWLKNVIFGEPTIAIREAVMQQAIAASRDEFGAS